MISTTRRRLFAATIALVVATCRDTTGPASVAGAYTASMFLLIIAPDTIDIIRAGGSITVTLMKDGTSSGQVYVPASANGGTSYTASLDGTFTFSNGVVVFNPTTGSFMHDMPFTVLGVLLYSKTIFSGGTIVVALHPAAA